MINLASSSGKAAMKKASKNDLENGSLISSPISIKGKSINNAIIRDKNPPKKHFNNKLMGSLFLSFLKI
jgi:hypothetical protein